MAQWNDAVVVTFNENDGGAGWKCLPNAAEDLHRHWTIFGVYRTRWILLKRFWKGLKVLEHHTETFHKPKPNKRWVFKPEIPE